MKPTPDLDPVSVLVVMLGLMLGPELAPLASAYSVIIVGAFAGVLVGLRRREPGTRLGAAGFCFVMFAASVLMTVPMSKMLAGYLPRVDGINWLLFPVSLAIPTIGDDWIKIGKWAAGIVANMITRRAAADAAGDKPNAP